MVLLAATIAVARLHTFDEPLERDITTYAVIGHELLAGRRLYSDLWDHKPPAIHLTYAAAETVAGYGPREVYLLNVLVGIAAMVGVWAAASAFARSGSAGLLAAAMWVVTSGDLGLQANQPNTEVFLNACLVWALALLIPRRREGAQVWSTLVAGALFAAASLYKPVAVAVAVATACALVIVRAGGGDRWRRKLASVALLAFPGVAAWLALFAWFALSGRLGDALAALVTFNRAYAGNPWGNVMAGLAPSRLVPAEMTPVLPMAAVALFALCWLAVRGARAQAPAGGKERPELGMDAQHAEDLAATAVRESDRRPLVLLVAYAAGIAAAVALPGQFYPHYYQLWLPLLAVAAASALAALQRDAHAGGRAVLIGCGGGLVVVLAALQVPSYLLTADEWSTRKSGSLYVATRRAAATIDALLAPGETFYEWGAETGLYFYTRRRPPTGVFFYYPLLRGPLAAELSARVIRDLTRKPPELVVVPLRASVSFSEPVLRWVSAHYAALPADTAAGAGFLLARRGGALEGRLRRTGAPAAR